MEILWQLLSSSCRLNSTFSSTWLSSTKNTITDTASRFSYTHLFQLAPYLDRQSTSKALQLGGTSGTSSGQKLLLSIFGMVLHPAPNQCTTLVKPVSSNLCSYKSPQPRWFYLTRHPDHHHVMVCPFCRPSSAQDHQKLPLSFLIHAHQHGPPIHCT